MFSLAVAGFCAYSSWSSFRDGFDKLGWFNLVLSAANAAIFLVGVL